MASGILFEAFVTQIVFYVRQHTLKQEKVKVSSLIFHLSSIPTPPSWKKNGFLIIDNGGCTLGQISPNLKVI